MKLDYSIQSAKDRSEYVNQLLKNNTNEFSEKYLEILSDYIVLAMSKEEKKSKTILTDNRLITINKRETSYQDLVSKFENGEDGLYNLIINDKNVLLTPKIQITEKDLKEIPALGPLQEAIAAVEEAERKATGKRKFQLKKQIIEMRKEQYIIKNNYKQPMFCGSPIKSISKIDLGEVVVFDSQGEPHSNGAITLFNPDHISALLCNYSNLKQESYGNFKNDMYYLIEDLGKLIERGLADYPLYYDLLLYKIDNKSNLAIQKMIENKYGKTHSIEYISCLWRNKIPKILAEKAKEEYILWYFTTQEKGKWKKCSRCGQIKLAHNRFFSKNNTSKDGYYSICKECRNGGGRRCADPKASPERR